MTKIFALCFFLTIPFPDVPQYESWWVMTSNRRHSGPYKTEIFISKPCEESRGFDPQKFERFCSNARKYVKTRGQNSFCLRTGLVTKERCEKIVKQNSDKRRIILRLIED